MEVQTELIAGTTVTFAKGSLNEPAQIVFFVVQDGQPIIVTDRTPFHPQSATWPDQPGDRGFITLPDGRSALVMVSHEGLLNRTTGVLFKGVDPLGIKRNDPDIHGIVLHVLEVEGDFGPAIGDEVVLTVDNAYREALSLQHTGVHLAALALNQCAAPFWTKDSGDFDGLGAPTSTRPPSPDPRSLRHFRPTPTVWASR